jgi:Calx-beta domain/Beta-propeller repeat
MIRRILSTPRRHHSWLRPSHLRAVRRASRALAVEALEDRAVPSTLDYSTFLGGNGTDEAYAVVADAAGNMYVTGMTSSAKFPGTAGGFDPSLGGVRDAFVAKIRPDGALAWATYLGGSGDERGHGIALDAGGNVYVTGRADSADFPTTSGSFDPTFNGRADAFVTKLTGDGALVYSTYLGGTGSEIDEGFDMLARRVGAISVDAAGNAYVTGSTTSGDFPTTPGAFRNANAGLNDAFVVKLNAAGSALVYSTYLGGADADRGTGIAVGSGGNAYVTGEVVSGNFPTTAGAFQPAKGGGFSDVFVTKLNAAGSAVVYSSYLGGTGSEFPGRLVLDAAGNAYVTGSTASFDFPTTAGAFQPAKATNGSDAFVTKVNVTGSALAYSTHLGGSFGDDFGEGIAVDSNGRAYVTGHTPSGAFPVADAFQASLRGVNDAFVASLNASGTALVYSSYLGGGAGSGTESGYSIAVDAGGAAHVVGKTSSGGSFGRPPFTTTDDAFQPNFGGGAGDAFVARVIGPGVPALPGVSVSDVAVSEGNAGMVDAVFTVSLSAASSDPVTVAWVTADGTAAAGSDYVGVPPTTLTFAPGETSKTVTVPVTGDTVSESDETFFVNLSAATNATIDDGQGVGAIVDDDPPPLPSLRVSDVSLAEGHIRTRKFVFTVTLSAPSSQAVTVAFATANGTATVAGRDYRVRTGTLIFAPGETTKRITVLVNGDRRVEPDETFFVNLSSAAGATLADSQGLGTIRNDDGQSGLPGIGLRARANILNGWSPDLPGWWSSDSDDGSLAVAARKGRRTA